ncbi:MAG TPA: VWA domain-containing protein [Terriglobia bacterium]|nr:VWA domain-containing protein [Terriglobia bacterium]
MEAAIDAHQARQSSCKSTVFRAGRAVCVLVAFVLPVLAVAAQEPSKQPFSVKVETQLVQVRVRVIGRDGKPVNGLGKSDFNVRENGRQRQVETLDYIPVPGSVQKVPPEVKTATATGQLSRHRVWVYIDSEIDSSEVPEAYQAIKQFVSSQVQPDFMVSLDGLPFTDDGTKLLRTLEQMHQHPYGRLPEVPPLINSTLDMEKQADYEWLLYSALLWGGSGTAPPPGFGSLTLRPGLVPAGRADISMREADLKLEMSETEREMSFYVRSALFRYLDVIYRLEGLQGEKVVVVLRSGLRTDPESMSLLHQFAADAMRHQIVFYTVDTRGLINIDPTTNRSKLLRYGVPIPTWSMGSPLQFQLALNDYTRTEELENGRKEGLVDIAMLTGGKSVTDTNDLHEVFNDVVEAASGYYVIGFYPADQRQLGRFRQLKISVNVPQASVFAPKGYYEPRPYDKLSKREKEIVLWQALQSEMPRDLNVAASVNVFRGANGQSVALMSTGVHLGSLAATRKKDSSRIHVTELAEIAAATGGTLPLYHGQVANITVANPAFSRAAASPTEFVTFNTRMFVSPGKHICKVVFRDDNTGKLGAEEVRFEAPDYEGAPSASTLLVTYHATPAPAGATVKVNGEAMHLTGTVRAGQMDFVPQPDATFYAGDRIYLLYELYNPPSYDFNDLAASTRTELLRNHIPVRHFNINWKIIPDPAEKEAVLIGTLDTHDFLAGSYQVVQSVPRDAQAEGKLFANFVLLPGQP